MYLSTGDLWTLQILVAITCSTSAILEKRSSKNPIRNKTVTCFHLKGTLGVDGHGNQNLAAFSKLLVFYTMSFSWPHHPQQLNHSSSWVCHDLWDGEHFKELKKNKAPPTWVYRKLAEHSGRQLWPTTQNRQQASCPSSHHWASHFLLAGAKPAILLPGSGEEDAATGKGVQGSKWNHMPIWNMTSG